ncbi:TRAP transporter substrate-binding protein DctP [Microbaculum marinum]|uniref:TRAP transporter substrate-binding protein DctP n=1 Tax=Microbaculum marinum TaxID=1764581 RepID=A0AAW9S4H1_9HYPH
MVLPISPITAAWLFSAAVWCGFSLPVAAETLRIQTLDEPGSIAVTGLERLAEDLRSASGGEIDMVVLPARSAVGPTATLDAMSSGAIDGHYSSPAYFAGRDEAFTLLGDTLALYPDPEARDRWLAEGGGLELARKLYDRHGARLVGFVHWPEEWLVSRRPASIVADLSDLKVRAPDGPVSDLLTKVFARPVVLGGRDTLAALDRGTVDAADWASLAGNIDDGVHAHAPYAVHARHSMPTTELSLSNAAWERLSPSARRLLENRIAQFSRTQRAAFDAEEAAARLRARQQGVTLLEMSPQSQQELRRKSMEVFEQRGAGSAAAAEIAASHRTYLERLRLLEPARPAREAAGGSG